LRLPVKVLDADRQGNGSWLVVARIGRSPARLVTGSGRQLRATRASAAVYRCTLVQRDGSWRILRLALS
jgi:DNA-binding transcriptional regulator PaaX